MKEDREKTTVEMTAEEKAQFDAFMKERARKEAEEKARADRETYRQMVDDELGRSIPLLLETSGRIADSKRKVFDSFRTIIDMKRGLFGGKVADGQRTHTFTSSDGTRRIILGVYVTDGYLDTVEDGIAIVKEYITSLANDEKTQALVNMVFRLLSRDSRGTLKAGRIVQLRRIAEEIGNERFLEGVRIIEESYRPEISRQFIRAEHRPDGGAWTPIPLGMTES